MTRNEYAARNQRSAEARAALARIPRPAPLAACPSCRWIDGADCVSRAAHVWPALSPFTRRAQAAQLPAKEYAR
jgi:hypothetical protein